MVKVKIKFILNGSRPLHWQSRRQGLDDRLRLRIELRQHRFQGADAAAERIPVGGDCIAQELQQLAAWTVRQSVAFFVGGLPIRFMKEFVND